MLSLLTRLATIWPILKAILTIAETLTQNHLLIQFISNLVETFICKCYLRFSFQMLFEVQFPYFFCKNIHFTKRFRFMSKEVIVVNIELQNDQHFNDL